MIATLTSKGQVTLPKSVRDKLELQAGDRLDFVVTDDGLLEVVPLKQPASKLRGILPKPSKSVTIEEMNMAIEKGARK
ncbi:MAG: AbrB/MazE/SpoVT family DNA-binding domain-containing protein [Lentisphaerae bacterium]|jgi:antitoxin PrlF|nr:AbrB/MazE/SpoVT family DNA-binding domain-containing protein [Lentisphaerota bacterium]MBT4817814.1 AbrB/MazE/SpoVT family DNA-binding domain-containing protein [Lentisphaerota bacterium]MBT5612141.1 AbrB/MazE/SpoVT family DNA-binding domain-containing protein [Lentisphaerota bacterium]MBT7058760.1 AbrB/MazE/SpoVT family DNA-binding domain-containing protein [Lentisphaerota bacterium]